MTQSHARRLAFIAEWYQEEAAIIKPFYMNFYGADNAIEIFDQKSKRTFLRRTKMPELSEKDFFVGSKLNIFGRQFDLVDYGDEMTRNILAKYRKKTFVLLKHSIVPSLGMVLCSLIDSNFSVSRGIMVQFTADQVKAFLKCSDKGDLQSSVIMNQLLAGPAIGFELIADKAVEKIKYCHDQSKECASEDIPRPLRALFDREDIRTGIFCSISDEAALAELNYFFDIKSGLQIPLQLENTTLGVIKPHAIKDGNLGKIISDITANGFKITALKMHLMERINCAEFYEVYRGVIPEYMPMVTQLASGVCMALEVKCSDETKNSYDAFRNYCGPMDPEIAKLLRPHTLRSKYGSGKTLNAVHCTDLPDDTVLELQYMFKILD